MPSPQKYRGRSSAPRTCPPPCDASCTPRPAEPATPLADHPCPALTRAALLVNITGGPICVPALALVLWWRRCSAVPALVLLGTVAAAGVASTLVKGVLARPHHDRFR